MVILGINPGIGYQELQSRDGTWAERIRRTSYSRCLNRVAFDDPAWLLLHGRNSPYWANLMRFTRRWTNDPSVAAPQVLNLELYPWHSDSVKGAMTPPAEILDTYVWRPLAEIEVSHVFAFAAGWQHVCASLGWPLLERYGPGYTPVPGSTVAGWNVAIFGMPSGQKAVVSWQGGYAGPPGLERTVALRRLLSDAA
jgi:hypothetical protein